MSIEKVDTLVVGAGQAGIAISEHLSNNGVSHIVLERSRIAERWDSLVADDPAWHDSFPTMNFSDVAADAFAPKEKVADNFVAYAKLIKAPIRCGVEVKQVDRIAGSRRFHVETFRGCHRSLECGGGNRSVSATCDSTGAGIQWLWLRDQQCQAEEPDHTRRPRTGGSGSRRSTLAHDHWSGNTASGAQAAAARDFRKAMQRADF